MKKDEDIKGQFEKIYRKFTYGGQIFYNNPNRPTFNVLCDKVHMVHSHHKPRT